MKNIHLFLKYILNNSLGRSRQLILAGFSLLFFLPGNVLADGNETLGIPSIAISPGSGIVAGGVGLRDKTAGTISVDVPVGATVQQVLIYWMGEGFIAIDPGDDSIAVEGTGITGVPIGVSISPDATRQETGYRQDITGLGLVVPGPNILQITGLEYSRDNYGAAVLVIYSDTTSAAIELLDGLDHAYFAAPGDRMVTVAQTINFSSSVTARTANIILLLGDATAGRPDEVEVTVGAFTQLFTNLAQSSDGAQHDTVTLQINVPAGETSLTVEPFSRDTEGMGGNPDSLVWDLMAFSLADAPFCGDGVLTPPEQCDPPGTATCNENCMIIEPLACRFTGGGVDTDLNWDHTLEDGKMIRNGAGNLPEGIDRYQFGGQAGASTVLPPDPSGEWTHSQQRGPSGRFTFHGGTSSAPEGTRIVDVRCSDPNNCNPARKAPAKQLDFDGIGTFKSIGKGSNSPTWEIGNANVTSEGHGNQTFDGTYHWFEVNVDDLGERGSFNTGAPNAAECPSSGFGEKGAKVLANCDCPDYYRITIYDGVDGATLKASGPNKTNIIYEVFGYIDGGNLQIHPPTGHDSN